MPTHHVTDLTVVKGPVDELRWQVQIRTGFFGDRREYIFLPQWQGAMEFYREPIPSGSNPPGPKFALRARWIMGEHGGRVWAPGEYEMLFATELPGDALDRIEQFRAGGRLFARLAGQFMHLSLGNEQEPLKLDVREQLRNDRRSCWAKVHSEARELTRDFWLQSVLAELRPANRMTLEVCFDLAESADGASRRAIAHIGDAQSAFDLGQYGEVARRAYQGIEELQRLLDPLEQRHGDFVCKRVSDQCKALRSICDIERHAERASGPTGTIDRGLAQHVLVATKLLASLLLTQK